MFTLYAVVEKETLDRANLCLDREQAEKMASVYDACAAQEGFSTRYEVRPVEVREYWVCNRDVYDRLEELVSSYPNSDFPVQHYVSSKCLADRYRRVRARRKGKSTATDADTEYGFAIRREDSMAQLDQYASGIRAQLHGDPSTNVIRLML